MTDKLKGLLKSGRMTYILIAVCILAVVIILLLPSGNKTKEGEDTSPVSAEITADDYCASLSAEIAAMVSAITGENAPHVTVTLRSMGETVYATEDKQSEKSTQEYDGEAINKTQSDGDTQKSYILIKSADGAQRPIVISQKEPEIRGVVIVSRRGNDAQIREKIIDAVKTALDLSSTQVCVTGRS